MYVIKKGPSKHKKLNILIFGPSNAGKSSLINNIFSFKNNKVSHTAKVRVPGETETKTIRLDKFSLDDIVNIFDSLGYEHQTGNYTAKLFSAIVNGFVKVNVDLTNGVNIIKLEQDPNMMMDVVLFVIPADIYAKDIAEFTKYIDSLKPFYDDVVSGGKLPFFVVTKIDMVIFDNKEAFDIKTANTIVEKHPIYLEIYKKLNSNFKTYHKISKTQVKIYPIVNYECTVNTAQPSYEQLIEVLFKEIEELLPSPYEDSIFFEKEDVYEPKYRGTKFNN